MQAIEKHKTQYTKITPVKTGTIFNGRIYFENLSDIELGALLFSLDLPEGLAHKIGMAKPLGLGSVKITPTLYLSDRKKRYCDFFGEIEGIEKNENIQDYKSVFEKYVLNQLNSNVKTLWDIERIKKLKIMLDFKNQKPPQSISYMDVKEFRARTVLPTPDKA